MEIADVAKMIDEFRKYLDTGDDFTIKKYSKLEINQALNKMSTFDFNKPYSEAMKKRVNEIAEMEKIPKRKWEKIKDLLIGLILGILATLIAQFLYDLFKR